MAYTRTQVCNIAVSHLGQSAMIGNVDTENSEIANACRTFFDVANDQALGDNDFGFNKRFIKLGLVEKNPTSEWCYSYRRPVDCLRLRRILSGVRTDVRDTLVRYITTSDDEGELIYTDKENAELEYGARISDPGLWTHGYMMTFTYLLAFFITSRTTGGDPYGLGPKMYQLYEKYAAREAAMSGNEEKKDHPPQSDFILVRHQGWPVR